MQDMTTSIVIEQEAVSGDFGLIIVVVMAILLTFIGSRVVFILCKQFNWKPMEGFRFCSKQFMENRIEKSIVLRHKKMKQRLLFWAQKMHICTGILNLLPDYRRMVWLLQKICPGSWLLYNTTL